MAQEIDAIHDFWFGELDERGFSPPDRHQLWFGGGAAADESCRRYTGTLARARAGQLGHWAEGDRGLVALVVLLDQFSRNIHRGTPLAFAGDERALALASAAVESGRHLRLPPIHRAFLYLPFEHSESLADQRESVRLFEDLAALDHPMLDSFARFARAHRDVVERFGRFPHRNAILGRTSTEAERRHLAEHGGF